MNRDTLRIEYGTDGKANCLVVDIDAGTAACLADALNEYVKQLRADAERIKTAMVKP